MRPPVSEEHFSQRVKNILYIKKVSKKYKKSALCVIPIFKCYSNYQIIYESYFDEGRSNLAIKDT